MVSTLIQRMSKKVHSVEIMKDFSKKAKLLHLKPLQTKKVVYIFHFSSKQISAIIHLMEQTNWKNKLYYGDNLYILRDLVKDESVDLIYLDPPFNSNATYNLLFKEKDGKSSEAQIEAFDDTWQWDQNAERVYHEVVGEGPDKLSKLIEALRKFLGSNDMMAYLVMMAVRLVELRRVLKSTGSIYLHCDPTASHYIKLLLDAVFGVENYRNEIVWKRKTGRGETNQKSNRYGQQTDTIFYYAKTNLANFESQYNFDARGYKEYVDSFFRHTDDNGRKFRIDNLASPSLRPNLIYDYKGYKPPKNGWAISKELMEQWDKDGKLYFPKDQNGRIQRKRYLDELKGRPVQNLWDDIEPIGAQAQERLGYPTQKPEALLERIIKASSGEGDVVLDPFCGCGTAVAVAERLKRRWIGIDITHLAITLMKKRLEDTFGVELSPYEVVGEPKDMSGAKELFRIDPYQFQWWAIGLVDGKPAGGEKKKGADRGIDGYINFFDDDTGKVKKVIISVKGGHVMSPYIRDLKGVLDREEAQIGLLITLEPPTKPMMTEAAEAGLYTSPLLGRSYPRLQILTIEQLLEGKKLEYPEGLRPEMFAKARRQEKEKGKEKNLFEE